MIPVLGSIILSLALGVSVVAILLFYLYTKNFIKSYFLSAWRATLVVSSLCIFATILMFNELLTSNFDINYVALHTSLETPLLYKVTAIPM